MEDENETTKLEQIREVVEQIESQMKELKQIIGRRTQGEKHDLERRVNILQAIVDKGDVITKSEYYQILQDAGMDRQGGGGWFVGTKPSLIYIAGERVALTAEGKVKLDGWKRKIGE